MTLEREPLALPCLPSLLVRYCRHIQAWPWWLTQHQCATCTVPHSLATWPQHGPRFLGCMAYDSWAAWPTIPGLHGLQILGCMAFKSWAAWPTIPGLHGLQFLGCMAYNSWAAWPTNPGLHGLQFLGCMAWECDTQGCSCIFCFLLVAPPRPPAQGELPAVATAEELTNPGDYEDIGKRVKGQQSTLN